MGTTPALLRAQFPSNNSTLLVRARPCILIFVEAVDLYMDYGAVEGGTVYGQRRKDVRKRPVVATFTVQEDAMTTLQCVPSDLTHCE